MHARGLTPFVTLHHYALPSWIHDGAGCHFDLETCSPRGWLDGEGTVAEISKFAGFAAREFGGEVDLRATQNEPLAVLYSEIVRTGILPPELCEPCYTMIDIIHP